MLQPITYFRFLARAALVIYFLAAALFLGLRYWVLPNIDQWRPQIAQQLSLATGTDVTLGRISAQWHGLNPSLQIQDLVFAKASRGNVLQLPRLRAVLSWRSIFSRSLQFASLDVHGLSVDVRRDSADTLWVMGQPVDFQGTRERDDAGGDALLQWVLSQHHVALTGASVRWLDEARGAPPLVLKNVTLAFQGASQVPRVLLRAEPPQGMGTAFELRGQLDLEGRNERLPVLGDLRGQLYVHVDNIAARSWRPWVSISSGLDSGNVSVQWWLAFEHGRAGRMVGDIGVSDPHWKLDDRTAIQASSFKAHASGEASDYVRLYMARLAQESGPYDPAEAGIPDFFISSAAVAAPQVDVSAQIEGLEIRAAELFDLPLRFDSIALRTDLGLREGGKDLSASIKRAHFLSSDMDVQLQGTWSQGGTGQAGLADITGMFKRASLAKIDEHLPTTVNLDAREWLAKALVAGQIQNARVRLKGDLEDFPWGGDASKGEFLISGDYVDGTIDYLPAEGGKLGWPSLTGMSGKVSLDRVDLRILADRAQMWPTKAAPISLHHVLARIPNIERNSVLTIRGDTQAAAQTYLDLAAHSALGGLLDNELAEASAKGNWEIPLYLRIPLLNSDDSSVSGSIRFDGGSFSLMPEMPVLEKLEGQLDFTDTGISTPGLKAGFLGGTMTFSGGVGGPRKGLQMRGQIKAEALEQYVGLQGMKRLKGQFPYQLMWQQSKQGGSVFTAESSLKGLSLDLPQPWGKAAEQAQPLRARWARAGGKQDMALNLALGSGIQAVLLHREGSTKGPYFYAGNVAVGQDISVPASGLTIDVKFPYTDLDAWEDLGHEFSQPLPGANQERKRPVIPSLQRLHVQSRQMHLKGLSLDEATLTVVQPHPARWRMDVDSTQTTGTIVWDEAADKKPGNVEAHFKRLALGSADKAVVNPDAEAQGTSQLADDALEDIPSIHLQVDKLILYGRLAGRLSVDGVRRDAALWSLDKLSLSSPGAELTGTGQWRLNGAERGLTVKANAKISNLGQYFDQLGWSNMLERGKGTIQGQVFWRNMPWRFDIGDLSGKVDVQLEAGRFKSINSRSARLLELLSLQSIQRLATLSISPASVFKEGFPFDRLYGTLQADNGIMSFSNYHVEGPAGNISIGGDVNLATEKLNLQAMVVPNLDMSGATIAAGIAINPIVGVGAFLTQWLLRNPLAKAMAVHYHVSGDWDEPKLDEAPAPTGSQAGFPAKKKAGPPEEAARPSPDMAPEAVPAP